MPHMAVQPSVDHLKTPEKYPIFPHRYVSRCGEQVMNRRAPKNEGSPLTFRRVHGVLNWLTDWFLVVVLSIDLVILNNYYIYY